MPAIKTIRVESVPLGMEELERIQDMFSRYCMCKNMFYRRFSGIDSMLAVESPNELRNALRKEQADIKSNPHDGMKTYEKLFKIQNRHWVMALTEVCANIKSMWSNLASRLKARIRDNENLTGEERSFLLYVVSGRKLWYQALHGWDIQCSARKFIKLKSQLTEQSLKRAIRYLRRITRKNKPKVSSCSQARCMLLDQEMYRVMESNGKTFLQFCSCEQYKPFVVELRSPYCYNRKGNVQAILDVRRKTVRIHKAIKIHTRKASGTAAGVDKGFAKLLSSSSGAEYGDGFGILSDRESERINSRNTGRNPYIQRSKELKQEIDRLKTEIDAAARPAEKIPMIRARHRAMAQLENLMKNNTGTVKYDREHAKARAGMETAMNHAIREFYMNESPSDVCLEDLSWQSSGKKGKRANRKLSSWMKGRLDERLCYIGSVYGAATEYVNAAYTSQFCSGCGAFLLRRHGLHHEWADCPNCGTINANTNAAKNIAARKSDKEVTLYTPYKKVKQILLSRYNKLHGTV